MRFSGDLVVQTSDGSIYYRGRKDDMVKRHGKRFHLQEVEKVLFSAFFFQFHCTESSRLCRITQVNNCLRIAAVSNSKLNT
jgi:acyl-CoA synthetase (AMP-forming)/AMP-acid ligase II